MSNWLRNLGYTILMMNNLEQLDYENETRNLIDEFREIKFTGENKKTIETQVTFFAKKHDKIVTRFGRIDEKCVVKTTKDGKNCFVFLEIDKNGETVGYKSAVGNWYLNHIAYRQAVDAIRFVPERLYADGFPLGWTYEIRFRTTGKTAGRVDKYYYFGHKCFRSIKEIQKDFKNFKIVDVGAWRRCWKDAEIDQRPRAIPFIRV